MNHASSDLTAFLQQHVRPYDPATDDYERPAFAADIKEGKNDPIYNAHSYHTKVPPRSIIPYILHYTQPGDLVLDLFCGSGMTGVAAQMCARPPSDILESFPELKDRVGPRGCILNDLSPAACHIAYNYNTPVDVEAFKREFNRIKGAVKEEFDWLYGTEHYEPAAGVYDLSNPDVAGRLKNPPASKSKHSLLDEDERTWELLTKTQVEARLGYPVTELPRDERWGDLEVHKVEQWICVPAMIQYTIWSDVYRCEGFITIEEPTGKISTRGKNAGKPVMTKRRVERGCGGDIVLWEAALVKETSQVKDVFHCPRCEQGWKKIQLSRSGEQAVEVFYVYRGVAEPGKSPRRTRFQRRITCPEVQKLREIQNRPIPYWFPTDEVDMGREMMQHGLQKRGGMRVSDFFFKRQLWALGRLWTEFSKADSRVADALRFLFTSLHGRYSKRTKWHQSRFGQCAMPNNMYIPSLMVENNIIDLCVNKYSDIEGVSSFVGEHPKTVTVINETAINLSAIPSESVDYVFTDPPFGQNIYYADCSLLWEAWLQHYTDESKEIVVSERRSGGNFKELGDYQQLMTQALAEVFRVLKPNRWATIEFNNSDGRVFDGLKKAVADAGFQIVNMLLLDKTQKSFKQVKGASGEEDVVDKDVLFNLHKPAGARTKISSEDKDLEQQLADAVRQHLQSLPERIKAEPTKYNDEHRTTSTINSMLMNTLIPRGVSVERLNLPFIERVCGRYFRKIGLRWYLRGEAIGASGWLGEETKVSDELTAIAWLRQQIASSPKMLGELKPLWMRATGLLNASASANLILERLLVENFWREAATNRWREPTAEEREKMNDDQSLRVFHDSDRLVTGTLDRTVNNAEVCQWIKVLFETCKDLENGVAGASAAHLGFDRIEGYRLIVQLSNRLTPEGVEPKTLSDARKQAAVAGRRLAETPEAAPAQAPRKGKAKKDEGPTLFDLTT